MQDKLSFVSAVKEEQPWNAYKALVVNVSTTEVSLLDSLVTRKVSRLQTKVPFVFKNYELSKELSVNLLECSEVSFCVIIARLKNNEICCISEM